MNNNQRQCRKWCERQQKKIALRLDEVRRNPISVGNGPEFGTKKIHYEVSERTQAITCGGIGAIHQLVHKVGLVKAIDEGLPILKRHRPYRESDHILNIAYNILSGGKVLDDIEVRRNDEAFLDAINARAIPDPTTAGDFLRRLNSNQIKQLMTILNEKRVWVWQQQPPSFFNETARVDADSTIVDTKGEHKVGMDFAYNGVWGYHPLLITLANTKEPLFIVNRSGNRPSAEGAAEYLDESIKLLRRAGFKDILLRGDTAFSDTKNFDRWDDDGVRFIFGYRASKYMIEEAEAVDGEMYQLLIRQAEFALNQRAKQPDVKEAIVRLREYKNCRLEKEEIAEFEFQPGAAKRPYRVVVLAKTIMEEKGQLTIGFHTKYFFYVTNDRNLTMQQVIEEANDRCDQENIIGENKSGTRALTAPLNTLEANWAYMVIASLAWSLKAWFALMLPVNPRQKAQHLADRKRVLRMEFRSFLQRIILVPAQIIKTGRRLVYRLLAWRPDLPILFRFLDAL
jgi:hypothetical protein